MKTLTLTILALVLGLGAIWLRATPQRISSPRAAPQQSHTLGQIALVPNVIVAGSAQPIVATVAIPDSAVFPASVSLIYSRPGVQGYTTIGTLRDDGHNGDAVAGDGTYSIAFNLTSLSAGEVDLQITAAFKNSVNRSKSPILPFFINRPQDTSGFQSMNDSGYLFTVAAPSAWQLHITEVPTPDTVTTESFEFTFPDGTVPFVISMYTPSQWQDLLASSGITPVLIGKSNSYFFGLEESDADVSTQNMTSDDVRSMLPAIYATFRAN